ncbi:hypothetical protein H922_09588 [Citrobacter freundii GTC 09629]|nr:hypothetical protein H922_09588 [Citrobacter freundii GTC 09629]
MAYLLRGGAIKLPTAASGVIEERNTAWSLCADLCCKDQLPTGKSGAGVGFRVGIKAENYRGAFWVMLRGSQE